MSDDFTVEQRDGVTTIRLLRKLSLEAILDTVDQVALMDTGDRRLWVLNEDFEFSAEEVKTIAARGKRHWPGAARVAYLAANPLAYGLLRMFEAYRKQDNYETRVFSDEQEALAWLVAWPGPKP